MGKLGVNRQWRFSATSPLGVGSKLIPFGGLTIKRRARLNYIASILSKVPYEDATPSR
jgi:hypothetical protein